MSLTEISPAVLQCHFLEEIQPSVNFLLRVSQITGSHHCPSSYVRVTGYSPSMAILTTAFPFLRVFYEPPCDRRVLGEIKTFWGEIPQGKLLPKVCPLQR